MKISEALELPCGAVLPNRFAKSAMSEILGSPDHGPTQALDILYRRWSVGGTGLLISGNVMIDHRALGEPQNVVLEDDVALSCFRTWAAAGTENKNHFWMQLNHPGKQSPSFLSPEPVAPSAVPLEGALSKAFRQPRELTGEEIQQIIQRFGVSAGLAQKAGFTGVQIHGAHGYLVSQFLSPHSNQRQDRWGGSLENRMRFVREIYQSIRERVGKQFPISIKLNSSDFRKGGFTEEDSVTVIRALASDGIDLIEVSGGTYESPAMMGRSTSREGYFQEFAKKVRQEVSTPLMLTGGFRSARAMVDALEQSACDVIGLARPLVLDPDLPKKIMQGDRSYQSGVRALSTGIRAIDQMSMLNITWYENQIALLGRGLDPNPSLSSWGSVLGTLRSMGKVAFKKRRA